MSERDDVIDLGACFLELIDQNDGGQHADIALNSLMSVVTYLMEGFEENAFCEYDRLTAHYRKVMVKARKPSLQ